MPIDNTWQMPNTIGLMDPSIIISEIEEYSVSTGLKTTTVCQMAFGNARYLDRLRSRLERLDDDLARFNQFKSQRSVSISEPQPAASAAQSQEQNHVETPDGC